VQIWVQVNILDLAFQNDQGSNFCSNYAQQGLQSLQSDLAVREPRKLASWSAEHNLDYLQWTEYGNQHKLTS
jgi:hypothetical protein